MRIDGFVESVHVPPEIGVKHVGEKSGRNFANARCRSKFDESVSISSTSQKVHSCDDGDTR